MDNTPIRVGMKDRRVERRHLGLVVLPPACDDGSSALQALRLKQQRVMNAECSLKAMTLS